MTWLAGRWALMLIPAAVLAQPCPRWSDPVTIGQLDRKIIPEASGIAVSRAHPGRLYHHNDSGDGPYFYVTNRDGSGTKRVTISGYRAGGQDLEAMSLGSCPGGGDCIFFGVIGDNSRRRRRVELIIVPEPAEIPAKVEPIRHIAVRYPDRPHNAEGLAVHPNGDIFVLTKGYARILAHPGVARLYRLPAEDWMAPDPGVLTFEYAGELDLPAIAGREGEGPLFQLVTGFDIAPRGDRFVVITYGLAYEFAIDLSEGPPPPAGKFIRGKNYRPIPLEELAQQEAVSYALDGRSIVYTTEARLEDASIVAVGCETDSNPEP